VVVTGSAPNHVVHVLLLIFTCGLWLPLWILIAATQKEHRTTLFVDEAGRVITA
jgi:hypothetical protein